MPATKKRSYARYVHTALELLGTLIATERRLQQMTSAELATRLGVARGTVVRLEKGDPAIAVGLAFEACGLLGIPLFQEDASGLPRRLSDARERKSLLPKLVRTPKVSITDEF